MSTKQDSLSVRVFERCFLSDDEQIGSAVAVITYFACVMLPFICSVLDNTTTTQHGRRKKCFIIANEFPSAVIVLFWKHAFLMLVK